MRPGSIDEIYTAATKRQRYGTARADIYRGRVAISVEPGADPLDADTRFEIGSIVKTMTATLLATFVVDDTLALDDPIGTWIDAGPCATVTLHQLATHTSGLPRLPSMRGIRGFRIDDPYKLFGPDELLRALGKLGDVTPGRFEYSNFGFMTLGHVLSVVGGSRFETLLSERVLAPAGVRDVAFEGDDRLIPGYRNGSRVAHWNDTLGGAGGIRASITAMAQWVAANLDPPTTLADAMALCHRQTPGVQRQTPGLGIGLAWMIGTDDVRWHNGGTAGFSTLCGFSPSRRAGRAMLMNASGGDTLLRNELLAGLRPQA
jgi:D-alanyl-D-alanine-carboxypeptidase/D-alanyl-D-alanine-endopeptidase